GLLGAGRWGAAGSGGTASGDIGDPVRSDLLGMRRAARYEAAVAGPKGRRLAVAGDRDLPGQNHDAGVEIMRMLGVRVVRRHPVGDDLIALAPQLAFEGLAVHRISPRQQSSRRADFGPPCYPKEDRDRAS